MGVPPPVACPDVPFWLATAIVGAGGGGGGDVRGTVVGGGGSGVGCPQAVITKAAIAKDAIAAKANSLLLRNVVS